MSIPLTGPAKVRTTHQWLKPLFDLLDTVITAVNASETGSSVRYVAATPSAISGGVSTVTCQVKDGAGNNIAAQTYVRVRTVAGVSAKLEAAASPVGTLVNDVTTGGTAHQVQEQLWRTDANGQFAVKLTDANTGDVVEFEVITDRSLVSATSIGPF